MKYTVQSGKYIAKNFWYILPFAIIPAFFFAFSVDKEAIYCALEIFASGDLSGFHFAHLFRAISVLNFASWQAIVFGLIGIVLIVVCVAMMLALLDKHMRIGKRTYNGLFSKLNDNLVSTTGYALLLVLLYELWALLTSAILFLFSRIAITAVAYSLSIIGFLAMHLLLIYAIGAIYLWLPCMQITGFKAMEALHYSYQLMSPVKWRILFGQIVILTLVELLVCTIAVFVPSETAFMLISAALYALLIMVYCVRMEIAYFHRDNIERADLEKYYR
ncbi:MAG: hypothetical protein J6U60_03035 [Clostridia bacterium]|nr:hypothetical protein [Clostridia bacterium]